MATAVLHVKNRDVNGLNGRKLRKTGIIPAVFYGPGMSNNHFIMQKREIDAILRTEAHIIQLVIDGNKRALALVQEVQRNPLTRQVIHVSFLKVKKGESTFVTIPIHLDGESIGVKQDKGDLNQVMREVEVECLPENVPDSLHADISHLRMDDSLLLRDIPLPESIKIAEKDMELTVASIRHHKVVVEVASVSEEEGTEAVAAGEEKDGKETAKAEEAPAAEAKATEKKK